MNNNILQSIIDQKKIEIEEFKNIISENDMLFEMNDNFYNIFQNKITSDIDANNIAIIAEIKKASPSNGKFRNDINHVKIAKIYEQYGASVISVVTDNNFFLGSLDLITDIRQYTDIAILRKDFIIDQYQITQSRYIGANAILLIASILTEEQLLDLENYANMLNLDVIIEIHCEEELKKIENTSTKLIGVNNRNLNNFEINKNNVIELAPKIK